MTCATPAHPVPPIGAVHASYVPSDPPVVLWLRSGTARVEVGAVRHEMTGGQVCRLPAGVSRRFATSPGSSVVPIRLPAGTLAATVLPAAPFSVPVGAHDWLLHQYVRSLGHLRGAQAGWDQAAGTLAALARGGSGALTPPPVPHSAPARQLARALIADPSCIDAVTEWARRLHTTDRTLRRQFVAETGLSLATWRRHLRLAHAASLLARGEEVAAVAHATGFTTVSGFSRAFSELAGVAPSRYRPQQATGVDLSVGASEVVRHRNHVNLAVCCLRGTARLSMGRRVIEVCEGTALWVPAGAEHSFTMAPGSILLPFGWQAGNAPPRVAEVAPEPITTPPDVLIHLSVTTYLGLRPDHPVAEAPPEVLAPLVADGEAHAITLVRGLAAALAQDPAAVADIDAVARSRGIDPAALPDLVAAATGTEFATWRSTARMGAARQLLLDGEPVHRVARLVGYRHTSGFARAFREAHRLSPTQFQRSEFALRDAGRISA